MLKVSPPLSLYVHLPWCVKKCPYCDFNAHPLRSNFLAQGEQLGSAIEGLPEEAYLQQLLNDLKADLPKVWGREVSSIFFGGGTPSLFSPLFYEKLLGQLRAYLPFSQGLEITLEANPGTIERGAFKDYQSAGINRVSLGVQTFSTEHLKTLGRIHDAQAAYRSVEELNQLGLNYNLDLMHGLPHQTTQEALFDLDKAADFGAPHISWYQLTLEPNTLFWAKQIDLPAEATLGEIETEGFAYLQDQGYERYEVSAFARKGLNRSMHNQNYWLFGDYLGIGAGAYSKITDMNTQSISRFFKFKHPKAYLSAKETFKQKEEVVLSAELPLEFMLNALRLVEGFPPSLFEARTGLRLEHIRPELEKAKEKGWLLESSSAIKASDQGFRFLNELLLLFYSDSSPK